ncbi:MAG TPA: FAD-dependent oxidoreductase [Burkholderiales bacterium]|nr:FAD-dependent oxidoreductase [Burkholderiales bacterium]
MTERTCDVAVIGGGPAGATAAALLAERGWAVTVLEKDRHPRFHIGESLLPHNNPLFERLGVLDEVRAIGLVKNGAQFSSMYHGREETFYFRQALDKSQPSGFEVHRADLDHILLRNAARKGATVFEETRVEQVHFEPDGVRVHARRLETSGPAGVAEWRARFLVDASGRDTFLADLFRIKARNPRHASVALYGHYENADRYAGDDEGNISIYWFDHGWIWFIPLARGITSVGAVCWPYYLKTRTGSLEQFFADTVALCPALAARLARARRIAPVTATGNYSYQAARCAGANYIMVGDAYAFVDPVFSSGVYLAMSGAFAGADAVDAALRDPAAAPRALARYERHVRRGIRTFSWFIYRITTPVMRDLLMGPKNVLGLVDGLISFLAGDIFRPNGVRTRIRAFQAIYYLFSAASPRRSLAAMRRRRENIRPVAP